MQSRIFVMRPWTAMLLMSLLIVSMVTMQVACTSQQVNQVITQIQAQLPALTTAVGAVLTCTNPGAAVVFGLVATTAQADLALFQAALSAWVAAPSNATLRQKVIEALTAMINKVDTQLLAANRIVSGDSQQLALLVLSGFSTVLHIIDGYLIALEKPSESAAVAAARQVKLRQVFALLDHTELDRATARNGVTTAQMFAYEQSLGF